MTRVSSLRLRSLIPMAMLAVACSENPVASAPLDLTGTWSGSNSAVALELTLSNEIVSYPCGIYGCTGRQTGEQIKLQGTYVDLRAGESVDVVSQAARLTHGRVDFTLFVRDDGLSAVDGGTDATTRLVGNVVDAATIEALLVTDYVKSSGGNSIRWTTWSADSSSVTLHRR